MLAVCNATGIKGADGQMAVFQFDKGELLLNGDGSPYFQISINGQY